MSRTIDPEDPRIPEAYPDFDRAMFMLTWQIKSPADLIKFWDMFGITYYEQ